MNHEGNETGDLWAAGARMNPAPAGPRRLLPHDLDLSLKYLSEGELQRLAEAVGFEMRRRKIAEAREGGWATTTPAQEADKAPTRDVAGLNPAQVNLIRAAVKAGVKPVALQRQFAVTRAQIMAALKSG